MNCMDTGRLGVMGDVWLDSGPGAMEGRVRQWSSHRCFSRSELVRAS